MYMRLAGTAPLSLRCFRHVGPFDPREADDHAAVDQARCLELLELVESGDDGDAAVEVFASVGSVGSCKKGDVELSL